MQVLKCFFVDCTLKRKIPKMLRLLGKNWWLTLCTYNNSLKTGELENLFEPLKFDVSSSVLPRNCQCFSDCSHTEGHFYLFPDTEKLIAGYCLDQSLVKDGAFHDEDLAIGREMEYS